MLIQYATDIHYR